VVKHANRGGYVLGVCNGFQILCESGLLPGVLMRNADLKFICKDVQLKVERNDTVFASGYAAGQTVTYPVAHHDGNFFADAETLKRIEGEGQVAFRYIDNPNGSADDIAGVYNAGGNVLGLMPHPERLVETMLGGLDGKPMFDGLAKSIAA